MTNNRDENILHLKWKKGEDKLNVEKENKLWCEPSKILYPKFFL